MVELEYEVMKRKLNFINSLKNLDGDTLAKQVFDQQVKHKWPGLVMECDRLCDILGLPRISVASVSKVEINNAVRNTVKEKIAKEKPFCVDWDAVGQS